MGFRFCEKVRYEYHKLNNQQNIQISNTSNVNKMRISGICHHSMTRDTHIGIAYTSF